MQALAHCFHINIFYRDYIVLVCNPAAQFMQIILSLVSYFFMAPGNFLFLPHIIVFAITASFLYNKNVINGDIISKVQNMKGKRFGRTIQKISGKNNKR